jgi:two-component system, response regulator PdtaR
MVSNTNFGAKVLIVEDEFLVALQLEDILCDGGYRVLGTIPDSAGLEEVDDMPDVALVDLNLRDGLTGPDVAQRLSNVGTQVIYVTANPAQIGKPAPTAIGVVQKPFSRHAILDSVAYALKGCPEDARPSDLERVLPPSSRQMRASA